MIMEPKMRVHRTQESDLGFGIWDLGFGIWDLGFGIWDLGFGIWDLGFGIWDLGFSKNEKVEVQIAYRVVWVGRPSHIFFNLK